MSPSRSGKLDPVLVGVELLGGSASFDDKMALALNGVDLGCVNSITGSTCRAKCSNILHDIVNKLGCFTLQTNLMLANICDFNHSGAQG
jgi:hypothetical protein